MILYRWRGASTNFGDELNTILWPRLLPGFFDGDPAIRFLGIGSVLDRRHSAQATKLVAGSGYGGYEARPILDETWIIHWVRGRRTAATLGLPARLALGDPASLLPGAIDLPAADGQDIGFMPHFESAAWGAWGRVTELAGVRLIDPRDHPLAILQAILRCRRLLSQALHGVIAADALRVPWIAIQPLAASHRPKWWDWADTMELRPRFRGLPASTPLEWARTSRLNGVHAIRTWLDRQEPHLAAMTSERLVTRAAGALRRAMLADPQQSSDATLDRCRSRMLDAVEAIRSQTLHAPAYPAISVPLRSRLQPRDDSAYQLTPIG